MLPDLPTVDSEQQPKCSDAINCTGPIVDELRLSIDGIYLNVTLEENMVERIKLFVEKTLPALQSDNSSAGQPRRWHQRRYTHGFIAYLNDALKWEPIGATRFHCATGPKSAGYKNTHFNWNPAKCDSAFVAGIIFDGYLNIPPSVLLNSTVSRIHLALDVPKARIDDQAFSWPKMTEVENRYSKGRTMYLGARAGATRIVIYDKRAEIHKSNSKLGTFLAPLHELVPAHELMRVEIRLKPSMPLVELVTLANPFATLAVQGRAADFTPLEDSRFDLALHEGFSRATSIFNPAEKKAYTRKLKKAGGPSWWEPEPVWEQQFPLLVDAFLMTFISPLLGSIVPGNNLDSPLIHHLAEGMTMS
jgi:hypothetical protein